MAAQGFQGYSPQTVRFFAELARYNNKTWFDEHRQVYESQVQAPSRDLVVDLGRLLGTLSRGVQADPRVNKSLFRINRDTRFSKDKTPYKEHLGLWWWEGPGGRMECPGFYFQLQPPQVMLAVGMHCFPDKLLPAFREAAADPRRGPALAKAVGQVQQAGYQVGGEHFQRVPRGYAADHPRAELLKYNGLYAWREAEIPPQFYTAELPDWCLPHYRAMLPIHKWLLALVRQAAV
ncbi:MAG: DUF2461 domain-containing protein [Desulfarculus sp.]|nr:MAG: DUF2461 domain-containing protein [Desulfarculus sp.]